MLKYILLFLGISLSHFCMAQTVSQVVDIFVAKEFHIDSVNMSNISNLSSEEMDSLLNISPVSLLTSFQLSDTNNIDSIYIQAGTSFNSNDIFDMQLAWTELDNMPLLIEKSSLTLVLRFGLFMNLNQLYMRCWIKNAQGTLSNVFNSSY